MAQAQHPVILERLAQPDLMAMQVLQVHQEIQAEVRRLTGLEKQDRLGTLETPAPTRQTQTKMQEF